MSDDVLELQVWKGDWGLPSVDPNCLAVLAYCRFSGVPVRVRKTGNTFRSPSGEFPMLKHKGITETKVAEIFSFLRKKNWGSDFELTNKQSADVIAFSSLLEEKLLPAVLHLWWIDGKTFTDFTRPWYARIIPFPLNFYVPGRKQKDANLRVFLSKGGENVTDSEVEGKIYRDAKECLNHLSYKLGSQEFFFGKTPSSLDALVFGYLAPILKAPLPNNQIQNHLKGCDNLCSLVNKILQRYFPPDPEEQEAKRKKEAEEKRRNTNSDAAEFPNKRRNMVLAAVFALTTMVGYAFMSGLIRLDFAEEKTDPQQNQTKPPDFQAFDQMFEDEGDNEEE
ncbi:metaxin-1-like isoform X1 [Haliotis cracherodii]|uniref:metaxin-1-like isoform X1 n=2 Tax=Haliotis rufescens TaxID=6454 RepID=UPI001EB045A9|nr:metaxin-1-like isoform X1 [Haliotis rufescens]